MQVVPLGGQICNLCKWCQQFGDFFFKISWHIFSWNLVVDSQLKSGGRFLVEIRWELLETVLYWSRLRSPPATTQHTYWNSCWKFFLPTERGAAQLWCHWSSMFALGEGSSVQPTHPPKRSSSSQCCQKCNTCTKMLLGGESQSSWNGTPNNFKAGTWARHGKC